MSSEPAARGPRLTRRRLVVALAVVAVLAVIGGVAGVALTTHHPAPQPAAAAPVVTTPVTLPAPPPPVPARTTIAVVNGPVPYSAGPGGPPVGTIPVGSWWGTTKALPVVDQATGWLQVRLPQRPNGLTGWIPSAQALLTTTTYGILVDVTNHRVRLYHEGQVEADVPAGTGTATDPTPLGQFYVMDVAPPEGPGWGPFIIDTNAHSEAITSWEGRGDAFTSIHGPLGADAAIGTAGAAISHGCVRLHDADLARFSQVPAGAPVVIVA